MGLTQTDNNSLATDSKWSQHPGLPAIGLYSNLIMCSAQYGPGIWPVTQYLFSCTLFAWNYNLNVWTTCKEVDLMRKINLTLTAYLVECHLFYWSSQVSIIQKLTRTFIKFPAGAQLTMNVVWKEMGLILLFFMCVPLELYSIYLTTESK